MARETSDNASVSDLFIAGYEGMREVVDLVCDDPNQTVNEALKKSSLPSATNKQIPVIAAGVIVGAFSKPIKSSYTGIRAILGK